MIKSENLVSLFSGVSILRIFTTSGTKLFIMASSSSKLFVVSVMQEATLR